MRSIEITTVVSALFVALPAVGTAQRGGPPPLVPIPAIREPAAPAHVRELLSVIAADSMEGRAVWKPGSDRAAKYIAEQMRKIGLVPAGDSGYFQRIPGAVRMMPRYRSVNGQLVTDSALSVVRLASIADWDSIPRDRRRVAVNVVGIIPGKTGATPDSVILVDAHYDHVGVGAPVAGDSIYNGADDDASGTVAVLEIARIMKQWPQPSRTVVFLTTTGEEAGLVGTRWYIENPVRPIAAMAANLEIEMIGRPDTIAIGPGRAWLTGFERSTMGEIFQRHGLPILADMRPSQSFFTRSDNIAFAQRGVPAHTLSSFNLHTDYHRVSDDVSKVDFNHMAALINLGAKAVWVLTEGPAPTWTRGMRPCPPVPRPPGTPAAVMASGGQPPVSPQLTPAQRDSALRKADSLRIAAQFPQSCPR